MDSRHKPCFDPCKYEQKRKIGSGVFGKDSIHSSGVVIEATHEDIGTVAIKRSYRASSYQSRELEMLEEIKDCENCLQLLDVFYTRDVQDTKNGQKTCIIQNLVFEYFPLDLEAMIDCEISPHSLKFSKIQSFVYQLLNGLNQLHSRGIVHRDIKPDNLFLDKKCQILKIGDFGAAKKLMIESPTVSTPHCFSQWYRPPECLLGISEYSTSADIWAAGCVIFQIITKVPLFPAKSVHSQFLDIMQVLGPLSKSDLDYYKKKMKTGDKELKNLASIKNEFKGNFFSFLPLKKYQFHQIQVMEQLLSGLLKYNPDKRLSASQALKLKFFKI